MAVEITSEEELREWLEDKPVPYGRVLANRTLGRVLPLAIDPKRWPNNTVVPSFVLATLRVYLVSFATGSFAQLQIGSRALTSAGHAVSKACRAEDQKNYDVVGIFDAASQLSILVSDVNVDIHAGYVVGDAWAALDTLSRSWSSPLSTSSIWHALTSDCNAMIMHEDPKRVVSSQLWDDRPPWFEEKWDNARKWLSLPDTNFKIWREWYYGRIEGLPHAFADFDDAADEKFYRWIVQQDDDWWKREPAEINAEITEFVDGLRKPQNAPDPALPSDAELEQNRRAIAFDALPNGQVGLRINRNADEVDHSEAAQERHTEALEEARAALEASRSNVTQATDVERPLERYLAALGEDTHGVSHALLISRGEKLRRIIASREDDFGSAVPFTETQAAALEDWLTAHNLLVGLDPFLAGVQRTARGPDAVPTVLDLEALKAVIGSVKAQDIPDEEASQALDDLADNVPDDAKADDRRLAQATEGLKNFIRGIGSLVKKHGWKAAGGGYTAVLWVQRNIEWLREVFVNEPSILSILEKIAALPL